MSPSYQLPSPAPTDEAVGGPKDPAINLELERLSTAIVTAINQRDFDFQSPGAQELVARLAPTFEAEIETGGPREAPVSWDEQVSAWKQRAESHPDVQFKTTQVSTNVLDFEGRAEVWMEVSVLPWTRKMGRSLTRLICVPDGG